MEEQELKIQKFFKFYLDMLLYQIVAKNGINNVVSGTGIVN